MPFFLVLFCLFLQVRSHSAVTGRAVTKNLHAQMSSPVTGEHTLVRKSLSVLFATDASCVVTTLLSMLAVT